MKQLACIIGTRPQLIKHSILLGQLKQFFEVKTIDTLQHYQHELNDLIKDELFTDGVFHNIQLKNDLTPAKRVGEMISSIANILEEEDPDGVLVYGDTDSTIAGAMAANKSKLPLVHIEAGERSFNKEMPEEYNRFITDHLSQIHFCSSNIAIENLRKESINGYYVGDIMKDLLFQTSVELQESLLHSDYIFSTIHRNYNKDNPEKLKEILMALNSLGEQVVFPIHPATLKAFLTADIDLRHYENIRVIPPSSYKESIHYQKFAKCIITDSGGIQKEAYWLKRPCITIRKETEWRETLNGNWNQLVYQDLSNLAHIVNKKPDEEPYAPGLYGHGNASILIAEKLFSLI